MSSSYFMDSQLAHGDPFEYVTDKKLSCKTFLRYMNMRLQEMFHYEDLPDSIPKEIHEYYLMNNGTYFLTKVNDKLYAFTGSFGDKPDEYYRPTKYVVANPYLAVNETFDINKDGVLMRNDSLWLGLYPMMARYASLMAENLLTIRTADIMLRVMALFTAPDDATKVAAEAYLKNLEDGKLGVIGEKRFLDDGIKMQSPPSNNGSYLTQFIELHQYLTGTFYNEIGLNANFNMKRESIGEGESSLNEDSLLPLAEHMLRTRKEDLLKVNAMYGTNITVEFDSSWRNNQKEVALALKKLELESTASQLAGGGNDTTGSTENADVSDSDASGDGLDASTSKLTSSEDDSGGTGDGEGDKSDNSEDGDSGTTGENGNTDGESKDADEPVDDKKEKDDDDDKSAKD